MSGESRVAAISQNFFVLSGTIAVFYAGKAGEKEQALGVSTEAFRRKTLHSSSWPGLSRA
jgi:hypothetical protein